MNYIRPVDPVSASWLHAVAPRIKYRIMPAVLRAMAAALRAVDRDIEQHGAVTYATVERVRRTRALLSSI